MDFKGKNGANHRTVAQGRLQEKKFLREKWAQVWLLQDLQYTYVQMYGQTDKLMHVCVITQSTECRF